MSADTAVALPPEHSLSYPNVESGLENGQRGTRRRYDCDVVIVGSGAGGAPSAVRLREAGFDVLVLEEGDLHRTGSFRADPISAMQRLYRDAGSSMILGTPPMLFAEGRCVGGSTVINGGMSWRAPDHVLRHWSDELGLDGTDPASMDDYFAQAERILNVEFQNEDTLGANDKLFVRGARELGWQIDPAPRNMNRCVGLNACALGCPTGAKQSMLVTEIPRALAGGARLITNARVSRVTFERGRASGVRGRFVDEFGRRHGRFEEHDTGLRDVGLEAALQRDRDPGRVELPRRFERQVLSLAASALHRRVHDPRPADGGPGGFSFTSGEIERAEPSTIKWGLTPFEIGFGSLGQADLVVAPLLVVVDPQEAHFGHGFQHVGERAVAVVGLVESRIHAAHGLLHE